MNASSDSLPTAERFIKMLSRSGLIGRDELRALLAAVPAHIRHNTQKLADHLVDKQTLTHFQAAKLLQGTWHGLTLGPFQVLAPLGRGGMGTVYLARNVNAGVAASPGDMPSLVALKVLPPKRAREEERTLARFLREMDMCRRVGHPHLTTTFEAGDIQGIYYIAMEYIRGTSLTQVVKTGGPLPTERAARYFSEVAAGLAHAHAKGLIHRDLKPSNLMVTPNGHAKVLDLGLAMVIDEELPQDKMIVGGQGYVVGTMDYIAPEQVDDPTQVDARADLYALGCSLYFALTGQPPYPGGTSLEKMKRHRNEYAAPVSDLNPTVPAEFARIVAKLMEKRPARRYQSADQVRDALLPWAAGDPVTPLDVGPMLSETEMIQQLEKQQSAEPKWWEAIPVITFDATAKQIGADPEAPAAATPDAASAEARKPAHDPLMVLALGAGAVLLIALMEFLRRR
jgi:eukaryotic-like serine/threonine-protein kinase